MNKNSIFIKHFEAMATVFSLHIATENEDIANIFFKEAIQKINDLEKIFNKFEETSDVFRLNHLKANETSWIPYELWDCLKIAQEISINTFGAFDIAGGEIFDLNKSNSNKDTITFISKKLKKCRDSQFIANEQTHEILCKTPGFLLDFGGIAKGFSLDILSETAKELNCTNALFSAGNSSILALSSPDINEEWKIKFNNKIISIKNIALATSGTEFQKTHIVDPRTGETIQKKENIFISAKTATIADAISTAIFVMTPKEKDVFFKSSFAKTHQVKMI